MAPMRFLFVARTQKQAKEAVRYWLTRNIPTQMRERPDGTYGIVTDGAHFTQIHK